MIASKKPEDINLLMTPEICYYNSSGFLSTTEPFGIHECGPSCSNSDCGTNMQVGAVRIRLFFSLNN